MLITQNEVLQKWSILGKIACFSGTRLDPKTSDFGVVRVKIAKNNGFEKGPKKVFAAEN